ncbi:thymidylate kinase [Desulfocucumis palustris]|uniref:Thymidylate kinase n=1 Tax=Desulfocucumis palustris TaxID=1898651 RepID=A0A2L2XLR1_9FIRM|nr:thymidylate kinase [Desulfocucumis palustris]GBF34901.1 thymidylate kinase [Desulfocucumis palustris]
MNKVINLTPGYNGKLIIVEGCDGSGKSTQLYLLKRWLEQQHYPVFFTEWNSSELVKKSTKKAKKSNLLTPTTFSLIHASDFADRYEKYILPHLRAGYLVLADRYVYTAFARDIARGCDPEWVRNVYGFAQRPDIAFYFKAPLEVSVSRILSGRAELKYHEAGMDLGLSNDPVESFKLFQGIIKQQYDDMTGPECFVTMDATLSIEEQQQQMREIVNQRLLREFHPPAYGKYLSCGIQGE